jgi:nitroreductase
MELEKAVLSRRSIRAFRPDPVPGPVVRALIEAARWTPSASNTQPWEFTVVGGAPLQALRSRLRAAATADPVGKPETSWPSNMPDRLKARRVDLANSMFRALGAAEQDKARRDEWFLFGIGFFDAPQVIVLAIERAVSDLALVDAGAVAVSLQLLAHDRGLGTCPQAAPLRYPGIFHEVLGIPATKRIVLALPIGYPVADAPVNNFARSRVPADDLITWAG